MVYRILQQLSSVFLGWSLGANDSANTFGTAVSSQMVRWRTAALLIAVSAAAGALLQGAGGLETYKNISAGQNLDTAFCATLAAAITATLLTFAGLPISTSQAVVGSIIGIGLLNGQRDFQGLPKIAACWVGTPVGAAVIAILLYLVLARLIRAMKLHFLVYDRFMRTLLILAGIYGAFALGANNVANATGVFYGAGVMGKWTALTIGGASIALGALTYSEGVMTTVGGKIMKLDAFSAFIVVASEAVTVHIYALLGVPVSTSQAIVGAVLGIGLLSGLKTVRFVTLGKIALGWLLTPVLGGAVAAGVYLLVS
jgi:PiT family inorganic phosphate transporter